MPHNRIGRECSSISFVCSSETEPPFSVHVYTPECGDSVYVSLSVPAHCSILSKSGFLRRRSSRFQANVINGERGCWRRSRVRARGLGGVRRVSFSIVYTDMKRIIPPAPPFTPPPSPCALLYVGVGALGAPLHWWSPSLYKLPACNVTPPDLRTPDIWARDGFSSSRLSQSPTRRKDPSSLRSATWARRCGGTAGGNSGEAGKRRRAVVLWTCAEMTHMWTRLNSFGKEPHNFLNLHRSQHFQKLRKSPQY